MRFSRARLARAVLILALSVACNAPIDPIASISLALQTSSPRIARGTEQVLTVTATRTNGYSGDVSLQVENVPAGVSVGLGSATTNGPTTTTSLTVQVATSAAVGSYTVRIRGKAQGLPEVTALLSLTVTDPPAFALSLSVPAITLVRGAAAPLTVTLSRTEFTGPVTLSLVGPAGITGSFDPNPGTGPTSALLVSIGPLVVPGDYSMLVRGTASGLAEQTTPLMVTVSASPIGLVLVPSVSADQGSSVTTGVTISRNGYDGPVALSAENLPAGMTAAFLPAAPTGGSSALTLIVGPSVAPGAYALTLRGSATGVQDATAALQVHVAASSIGLILLPGTASLLPGSSATPALRIIRAGYDGPVALSIQGAPPGLTVTPTPAIISETSATLLVSASAGLALGPYSVTVRATPMPTLRAGGGAARLTDATATLQVTVSAPSPGLGNVVIKATGCPAPAWVAGQDGAGPWIQVLPVSGAYTFSVASGQGGYAYATGGNTVVVQYLLRDELTAGPIEICAASSATKTVSGSAVHRGPAELFRWSLGGAVANSTQPLPDFSLVGVKPGVHDLVGWGSVAPSNLRGLIRRDVDLPDGGSLGSLDLTGTESFAPISAFISTQGSSLNSFAQSMSFLTTAACTANPVYTSTNGNMFGIPVGLQRPDDFYQVTIFSSNSVGTASISATTVFHSLISRVIPWPPIFSPPSPVQVLDGSIARLSATFASIPGGYNLMASLQYSSGVRSHSISASPGYSGLTAVTLAMPDFGGVSGFPISAAMAPGASGNWVATLTGASPLGSPPCSEGARTIQGTSTGVF